MQDFLWNAFYQHPFIATMATIVIISFIVVVGLRAWYAHVERRDRPLEEKKQKIRELAFQELWKQELVSFSVTVDKKAEELEVMCRGPVEAIRAAEEEIQLALQASAVHIQLKFYDINDPIAQSLPTFGLHLLTHQATSHVDGCECEMHGPASRGV